MKLQLQKKKKDLKTMTDGFLIECSNCLKENKRQILGRVMNDGDLIVLRFHHGTTVIKSKSYQLLCSCGYGYNIQGTVISSISGTV